MNLLTKTLWDMRWHRAINWNWIKGRWENRRCDHNWMPGENKKNPHYACHKCGTWRWWPLTWRLNKNAV